MLFVMALVLRALVFFSRQQPCAALLLRVVTLLRRAMVQLPLAPPMLFVLLPPSVAPVRVLANKMRCVTGRLLFAPLMLLSQRVLFAIQLAMSTIRVLAAAWSARLLQPRARPMASALLVFATAMLASAGHRALDVGLASLVRHARSAQVEATARATAPAVKASQALGSAHARPATHGRHAMPAFPLF